LTPNDKVASLPGISTDQSLNIAFHKNLPAPISSPRLPKNMPERLSSMAALIEPSQTATFHTTLF
jgi:hypothetical protein